MGTENYPNIKPGLDCDDAIGDVTDPTPHRKTSDKQFVLCAESSDINYLINSTVENVLDQE